ncbi:kinase-like domain-containing protein [Polychytrium aggregatum]|uniref:kinase-like domain-containing protein n=1 Tax=Polychytrium aggregatum TaxID=110093 RepID=UPI0022FF0878|nr:kinase-like domain-containing protein [Polychytrium aggregatum]KAI9202525.1 kinase-like domain-containing protein [Polychytrium aggregatum]
MLGFNEHELEPLCPDESPNVFKTIRQLSAKIQPDSWTAVKLIRNSPAAMVFAKEASHLSDLSHKNVVSIIDVIAQDDPQICAVLTNLFPLKSLYEFLHISDSFYATSLDTSKRISLLAQTAEGLHFLHSSGITHSNIKSKNVLIDVVNGTIVPKLSDYALSVVPSAQMQYSASHAPYLAPESFGTLPRFTTKSDIYGFAMLCWETMERAMPFSGLDPAEIRELVLKGHRESLSDNPLKDLIKMCWLQSEGSRPETWYITYTFNDIGRESRSSLSPPANPNKPSVLSDPSTDSGTDSGSRRVPTSQTPESEYLSVPPEHEDALPDYYGMVEGTEQARFAYTRKKKWIDNQYIQIGNASGSSCYCIEYPDPKLPFEFSTGDATGLGKGYKTWTIKLLGGDPTSPVLLKMKKIGGLGEFDFNIYDAFQSSRRSIFSRRGLFSLKYKFSSIDGSVEFGWAESTKQKCTYTLLAYPDKRPIGQYTTHNLDDSTVAGEIWFENRYIQETPMIISTALLLEERYRIKNVIESIYPRQKLFF